MTFTKHHGAIQYQIEKGNRETEKEKRESNSVINKNSKKRKIVRQKG